MAITLSQKASGLFICLVLLLLSPASAGTGEPVLGIDTGGCPTLCVAGVMDQIRAPLEQAIRESGELSRVLSDGTANFYIINNSEPKSVDAAWDDKAEWQDPPFVFCLFCARGNVLPIEICNVEALAAGQACVLSIIPLGSAPGPDLSLSYMNYTSAQLCCPKAWLTEKSSISGQINASGEDLIRGPVGGPFFSKLEVTLRDSWGRMVSDTFVNAEGKFVMIDIPLYYYLKDTETGFSASTRNGVVTVMDPRTLGTPSVFIFIRREALSPLLDGSISLVDLWRSKAVAIRAEGIDMAPPAKEPTPPPPVSSAPTLKDFDHNSNDRIDDEEFTEILDGWVAGQIENDLFFQAIDAWTLLSSIQPQGMSVRPARFSSALVVDSAGGRVIFRARGQDVTAMEVQVFNLNGQRIFAGVQLGKQLRWSASALDGERLSNGVYLFAVTVEREDGQRAREVGRLVILR